ncbi:MULTISPECIES: cytochrome P450 [Alphaproteobacteria]|uniref:Cytochrome P450 n=2 Tax=Alphaproteobacteria TaxID=28211 RepID=A0A512HNP8_9HYPH|nr:MULTISPECIES: cytochrome P450 [Alphaproteobacteria]GEO87075.1 cytochrome P450 [Ciceribacter naphthalenivorans]GLR23139.1 cytochrome P450 [Ciceribacter naphthalenivorans]GLT05995.1 cytochrome P450 [Sphingomonas psychrolutea]
MTAIIDTPLSELDPSVQRRFQTGEHFAVFDRLRAEAPVYLHEKTQYGPYWSITRYKDIIEAEANPKVFSSDAAYGGIWIKDQPKDTIRKSFMTADPPEHDVQRKVVNPIVSPMNLHRMEEEIRDIVNLVLDSLPLEEEFDWVSHVSVEVTGRVLCKLMDFPVEERLDLSNWSDIVNTDVDAGTEITDEYVKLEKLRPMILRFRQLFSERAAMPPQNDLISMLAHAQETLNMEPQQFVGMIVLLMVGGNDTTRNSITGGLDALNKFPEEYAKLRANPKLIETMVPEIIRWVTPVAHMRRTALEDIEFKGQQIKKGDKVVLWYCSGNRDEEVIDDPYRFRIDRPNPRQHVSFGFGIHRCLGNRMAELQLRVLWEEILNRGWVIETVGDPIRRFSNFVVGIDSLKAVIHPGR